MASPVNYWWSSSPVRAAAAGAISTHVDRHGDMLDAVRWACAGGDIGRSLDWSRAWLGLPAHSRIGGGRLSSAEVARIKADTTRAQVQNKEDAEHLDAEHRQWAQAIWTKPSR